MALHPAHIPPSKLEFSYQNYWVEASTGWGGQSWTVFGGPAAVAVGGCERKD
jgi:hypothetical protein